MDEGFGPRRIQLSRKKGWRMPPNTVKVSRPGKWGNPFRVSPETGFNRAGAVQAFRIRAEVALAGPLGDNERRHLDELRGKNLACWRPLDQPCHADVLLELANASDSASPETHVLLEKKDA